MKIQVSLSAKRLSQEEYIQQMIDSGLKPLGEGNYGTVFPHPTDKKYVIKVSTCDTSESDSYAWLKWCMENPNLYVPHVRSLERVGKQYYIAEMERLKPASHAGLEKFINSSGLNQVLQISKFVPIRWDMHPQHIDAIQDKVLSRLMKTLHRLSIKHQNRHGLDITAENIMRRGSQFVFSDPIV